MSQLFTCPHCGVQTRVPEQFAGLSGPCASCGRTIRVPAPSALSRLAPSRPRMVFGLSVIGLAFLGMRIGLSEQVLTVVAPVVVIAIGMFMLYRSWSGENREQKQK